MNDTFTPKSLEKLINTVQSLNPKNDSLIFTPNVWMYELKQNPQYFCINNEGELLYNGYKVVTIPTLSGSDKKFWFMANQIIKKEN